MIDFIGFSKIPRLSRTIYITEKIDGTNGCIHIGENSEPFTLDSGRVVPFMVGSRKRWIFPENDNMGFARWAYEHSEELLKLGPGSHHGEWWGKGIQRGYDIIEKRFSLFNVSKWIDAEVRPKCCYVVPTLYMGPFETNAIEDALTSLWRSGSEAAPGFMRPEGVVIFHTGGNCMFKKTLEKDDEGKGVSNE